MDYHVVSFLGIFVFLGLAWLLSPHKRHVNWHVVGWGIGLQLLFGIFVFQVPAGRLFFLEVNDLVDKLLRAAQHGMDFVFGPLATAKSEEDFILAFQALPAIVFFSALMSMLYFFGIMPFIIRGFAWIFTKLMRISGAESLCASSNIFVGVESALTIKPYLPKMTRSELCTILTAGMATVASNVLGLYVILLSGVFQNIGGHLVSASILSAPAALAVSKLILPETEKPETLGVVVNVPYQREDNVFQAIINGANNGLKLILGIVALLLAVLGLIQLVDIVLLGAGWRVNAWCGWSVDWSLGGLLGYLFRPLVVCLGVPFEDVPELAELIGGRLVQTEIPGYKGVAALLANGDIQPRSAMIATYALCGFAHVASVAIFVGGLSAIAPSRSGDLARVAWRALIAATLACLITACVAGLFPMDQSILLGDLPVP